MRKLNTSASGLLLLIEVILGASIVVGQQQEPATTKGGSVTQQFEEAIKTKEPQFKLAGKLVRNNEEQKYVLLGWKSGEDFVSTTTYELSTPEEAADYFEKNLEAPISVPVHRIKLEQLGDEAYMHTSAYSKDANLLLRKGMFVIVMSASTPDLVQRFAKHLTLKLDTSEPNATTNIPTAPQSGSVDITDQVKLVNVKAELVTFKGRKALRVNDAAAAGTGDEGRLVVMQKTDFQDGIIEVDLAGEPGPGAGEGARGFVGIAFRVAADAARFECIYLRPTNGRAEDQLRRNHSVQYISIPGFPWELLRKDFPAKYETYVDLIAGEWTKMKIDVRGKEARLFVNGVEQPTLIVDNLLQGQTKGAVALWIGPGTVAHFANLRISK